MAAASDSREPTGAIISKSFVFLFIVLFSLPDSYQALSLSVTFSLLISMLLLTCSYPLFIVNVSNRSAKVRKISDKGRKRVCKFCKSYYLINLNAVCIALLDNKFYLYWWYVVGCSSLRTICAKPSHESCWTLTHWLNISKTQHNCRDKRNEISLAKLVWEMFIKRLN